MSPISYKHPCEFDRPSRRHPGSHPYGISLARLRTTPDCDDFAPKLRCRGREN
jgi:hypothetical protein